MRGRARRAIGLARLRSNTCCCWARPRAALAPVQMTSASQKGTCGWHPQSPTCIAEADVARYLCAVLLFVLEGLVAARHRRLRETPHRDCRCDIDALRCRTVLLLHILPYSCLHLVLTEVL